MSELEHMPRAIVDEICVADERGLANAKAGLNARDVADAKSWSRCRTDVNAWT